MADLDAETDAGIDDDDEALRWAGDEERGRESPRVRARAAAVDADAGASAEEERVVAPGGRGRAIAAAVFAIPYLAIAVGWIFSVLQLSSGSGDLLYEIVWQFGEFLAVLVAPLWFGATLTLTRASRPLVRVGWLALGLGVLLPWPLLLNFVASLFLVGSVS